MLDTEVPTETVWVGNHWIEKRNALADEGAGTNASPLRHNSAREWIAERCDRGRQVVVVVLRCLAKAGLVDAVQVAEIDGGACIRIVKKLDWEDEDTEPGADDGF